MKKTLFCVSVFTVLLFLSSACILNFNGTTTTADPYANMELRFVGINGTAVTPTNYLVINSARWPVTELKCELTGVDAADVVFVYYSLNYGSDKTNGLYHEAGSATVIVSNLSGLTEFNNSFAVMASNVSSSGRYAGGTLYVSLY